MMEVLLGVCSLATVTSIIRSKQHVETYCESRISKTYRYRPSFCFLHRFAASLVECSRRMEDQILGEFRIVNSQEKFLRRQIFGCGNSNILFSQFYSQSSCVLVGSQWNVLTNIDRNVLILRLGMTSICAWHITSNLSYFSKLAGFWQCGMPE